MSADLVSLEDTISTPQKKHQEPSLLDAMEAEQSSLNTPSLSATNESPSPAPTPTPSAKPPLSIKTSYRKSVDFHPSVSSSASSTTSSPFASPRHAKRQSLSFPINVTPSYYPATHFSQLRSPQHTRTSSEIVPGPTQIEHVEPSSDPAGFLTVLAGQERRVLELKEELLRADAELEKLKRKWAMHEATRKRSDTPSAEQLRSLQKSSADDSKKKHARRQSMGPPSRSNSKRTTFHNTKHQRTLSLLSPDRTNGAGTHALSFPQPDDVMEPLKPKRANTTRETTSSNFLYESGYERSRYAAQEAARRMGHQEALIATGKQMAEDFKDGLWTFIEDLRQATIGEEANGQGASGAGAGGLNVPAGATPLKKKGSKNSLKISPVPTPTTVKPKSKSKKTSSSGPKAIKLVDIGDDFWTQMDPDGPLSAKPREDFDELDFFKDVQTASTYKKGHIKPESVRWSSSTIVSEMGSGAMSPGAYSTPRTSTSSRSRSNSPSRKLSIGDFPEKNPAELIQALADNSSAQQQAWNAIAAPLGNIKKTTAVFLSQIEKGLAPPPVSQSSYYDLENARSPVASSYDAKSKKH